MEKGALKRSILLVLVLAACGLGIWWVMADRGVTAQAWSGDGKYIAMIKEIKGNTRTFGVLVTNRGGSSIHLYTSPEEGAAGTERIIWSPSSTAILIVGKNFNVDPKMMTTEGEQIYLVFDVKEVDSKKTNLWCNAATKKNERVTEGLLKKYNFPVTLAK